MRESDFLEHIARAAGSEDPRVLIGPGDDCALVQAPQNLLLKVDQVLEGRHFLAGTPMNFMARKAVRRCLSDVAAMAGSPVCMLVAATLPRSSNLQADAHQLLQTLLDEALAWSCPLVGGDTTIIDAGHLALTVTIAAAPHASRGPVLRSAAKPGDHVYVTGHVGQTFNADIDPSLGFAGAGHHLTFVPRLAEARALASTLGKNLHAMMDTSDGLGIDASRLARASGVRIVLDARSIPLRDPRDNAERACAAGEDYELLFTSPANLPPFVAGTQTPVTRIGRVESGHGCELALETGAHVDASPLGWNPGGSKPTS